MKRAPGQPRRRPLSDRDQVESCGGPTTRQYGCYPGATEGAHPRLNRRRSGTLMCNPTREEPLQPGA